MDNAATANTNQSLQGDQLLSAACKNQSETIRRLVTEHGVSPSYANGVGQSALHIASLWGHVEAVRTLVELGANVRAKNNMTGASPLHMVAQSRKGGPAKINDRIAIVECLVQAGAATDQMDKMGNLPADCPTFEEEEYAPLLKALQPSAPLIVQALESTNWQALKDCLEQDSSAVATVFMGKTPVMKVVEDIIDGIGRSKQQGDVALSSDGSGRSEELLKCLKLLLEHGAKTELVDAATSSLDESPLYRLLTAMLDEGHNRNNDGGGGDDDNDKDKNPKMLLCAVGYLLDGGAVLDDKKTTSLFHQAARRNQVPFARYCVETLHVDPNSRGRQGMTALQFAARSGQVTMLDYLLGLPGIDPTIADDRGTTALDAARVNDRAEAVARLEQFAANDV